MRLLSLAFAVLTLCFCRPIVAEPTTQPVATQSDRETPPLTNSRLADLIERLGDDDPSYRADAMDALLLLPPSELDALKAVAISKCPLSPAQRLGLQTVVTHLVLTGEKYLTAEPSSAIVGVTMSEVLANQAQATINGLPAGMTGVEIVDRIPGFECFALLHDGDIVVSLPGVPTLTSIEDFRAGVSSLAPGTRVSITLYRNGKRMIIPVLLYPKPAAYIDPTLDWRGERINFAQQVWHYQWEEAMNAPKPPAK